MHSQKSDDITIVKEKQIIASILKLQDNNSIQLNDIGWDSRVYIVNTGEAVFKFPRSDQVRNLYTHEIAGYKLLENINTDVILPTIKWEHENNDYFGYEGIVGTELDKVIKSLNSKEKRKIGRTIGSFLSQLHGLELPTNTVSIQDEIDDYQNKYKLGLQVITRNFDYKEQQVLHQVFFEQLPSELKKLGSELALCHGDLGYWNMIYGVNGELGIIDFGDIRYFDISKDFIGLKDKEILECALEIYGEKSNLREKINLRKKILRILDLPFYIGKNDKKGIELTVESIRKDFFV